MDSGLLLVLYYNLTFNLGSLFLLWLTWNKRNLFFKRFNKVNLDFTSIVQHEAQEKRINFFLLKKLN